MEKQPQNISILIRRTRQELELTMAQVAKDAGMSSHSFLQRMEREKGGFLQKLARILDVLGLEIRKKAS